MMKECNSRITPSFFSRLALGCTLLALVSLPVQGDQVTLALAFAQGADPPLAAEAVQRLRSAGQAGVDALLAAKPAPGTPLHQRWERVLESVCAQRDCATSGLFWHTDFERAQEEARKTGRPILSLRLLGQLDEEVSCANSRFFRSVLYPDPHIATLLRQRFVLHWESVRPVPRITIDYGDGRSLQGTITGNSIHYVLDSKGRLVDALPGLYGPGLFLDLLEDAAATARNFAKLEDAPYLTALTRRHIETLLARELEFADRGGLRTLLAGTPAAAGEIPTAREAGTNALSKALSEQPLVQVLSRGDGEPAAEPSFDWAALAQRHRSAWKLSDANRRLILAKHRAATGKADDRMLEAFERVVGLDTMRNEYLLHTILHQWLATPRDAVPDLAIFNDRVYAELFLTPKSDPWLGLYSPETYLALAPVDRREPILPNALTAPAAAPKSSPTPP